MPLATRKQGETEQQRLRREQEAFNAQALATRDRFSLNNPNESGLLSVTPGDQSEIKGQQLLRDAFAKQAEQTTQSPTIASINPTPETAERSLEVQTPDIGAGQAKINQQQQSRGLQGGAPPPNGLAGTRQNPTIPPPQPQPQQMGGVESFFRDAALRFGGSSLAREQFNRAQAQLQQFEVSKQARLQRAQQNLPRFEKFILPNLKPLVKSVIKQKEQEAKEQGTFYEPSPNVVMEAAQIWNSTHPQAQQITNTDLDTFVHVPRGSMAFIEQGILPLKETLELKKQGMEAQQKQEQDFKKRLRETLQPDDLFAFKDGPQEQGPTPEGPPLAREKVPTALLGQLAQQQGMTTEEFQTLLAGRQGRLETRPDGTQETAPIRGPLEFDSKQLALLETAQKGLQTATTGRATLPADIAKIGAKSAADIQEAQLANEFKANQQILRNRQSRTENDKNRKLKVGLQAKGHTNRQAIIELEKRLALANRTDILKQQAEIENKESIQKWEQKKQLGQMTFGQKVVLQDLQAISAMERIDAKSAHDKIKFAQTHGGDGAARDALKYMYKSGKVDMQKLATQLATDKPLNQILKDVLLESVDENFNALGQRILQITSTTKPASTKQSQLQSLQEEYRQGGYKADSKERQEIQAAFDLQDEGRRSPHAGTNAANKAVTASMRSSGVEKFNQVTGEFQIESLTPGNVNWGRAIKRMQIMANTDPALKKFLQPQINGFRSVQEATGKEAARFKEIEKSVIQDHDRKLHATDAQGNPVDLTMGDAIDVLRDYDINSPDTPPEFYYQHNGVDWLLTVNKTTGELEMIGENDTRILRGTGSSQIWQP